MILPDLNLLLYAHDRHCEHHPAAVRWWESVMSAPAPVGLSWVVILGFLRLATSSRVYRAPASVSHAVALVRSWLALPQVRVLQPGAAHWEIFARFVEGAGTVSNLATDAHLAALAVEYNAIVHTNDTDFKRFPGVRVSNPLA
ncbi:MAG: TA system VapC family ribonuclease toxin [Bryobacteraceae bacterium]